MSYRWKPSATEKEKYHEKMIELEEFLKAHPEIYRAQNGKSFYFMLGEQKYRVSSHTVEASNEAAFNFLGDQIREVYHPYGRESDTIYIHASPTRFVEIYNDLASGYQLDGRGRRKVS